MVTAVVAGCAVLAVCGFMLLALRRARIRTDRRLDAILQQVGLHLDGMSASVARAVDAATTSLRTERPFLSPTLDFDELLESIVEEARARTGADAVVLRVEGTAGRPVVASTGAGVDAEALDASFAPPRNRVYDAALIDWTYSSVGDPDDAEFQSALVVPLVETARVPGTLAAYALRRNAFGPGHTASVRSLLGDAAVALGNARRFAELESRVHLDPVTGTPNRRGYVAELGREVARAQRTGRPLSVVLVDVGSRTNAETTEGRTVADLARLLVRVTRRSDIPCRRGENELAILLPGTSEAGAAVLTKRIEAEATRTRTSGTYALTLGIVERQHGETPDALDARMDGTLGRQTGATVSALDDARNASTAAASTVHSSLASSGDLVRPTSVDALRRDALDTLRRALSETLRFGRSLAVVAVEVDGLDEISDREGREAADVLLARIAGRFDRSLGTGTVHRLGAAAFVLVLPGATVHESEALIDALQSSLEPPHDEAGLRLSAGITELGEDDDAEAGLTRAEHALWQARQAGPGTVVVAVPNKRPTPRRS